MKRSNRSLDLEFRPTFLPSSLSACPPRSARRDTCTKHQRYRSTWCRWNAVHSSFRRQGELVFGAVVTIGRGMLPRSTFPTRNGGREHMRRLQVSRLRRGMRLFPAKEEDVDDRMPDPDQQAEPNDTCRNGEKDDHTSSVHVSRAQSDSGSERL